MARDLTTDMRELKAHRHAARPHLLAGPSGRRPAFAGAPSADLALTDVRLLDRRLVLEEYRPTGRDIPRA